MRYLECALFSDKRTPMKKIYFFGRITFTYKVAQLGSLNEPGNQGYSLVT